MRIICITGKAGSGKDTVGGMLRNEFNFEMRKRTLVIHFADLLKYMCAILFDWDGIKDERGRRLLQIVGTDIVRSKNPNYWVDFIADILSFFPDEWDYVIIPDCRFANEVVHLRDRGYEVDLIRVLRTDYEDGLTEEQRNHSSENNMDWMAADYTVTNNSDLKSLSAYVRALAEKIEWREK